MAEFSWTVEDSISHIQKAKKKKERKNAVKWKTHPHIYHSKTEENQEIQRHKYRND